MNPISTFGIGSDGKMRGGVPPETTYFSMNSENAACHPTLGWQNPMRLDESDGMRRRVRASPSLIFFSRRWLGSYLWAEGAVKCHPQNDDGGVAIEVLSASVWVYPSVLVLFGIYAVAVVTAVLLCVTHSESVVPVRAISEEEHY